MYPLYFSFVLLADILVFTYYVIYVLREFGIPVNLSITYYSFERRRKGTGVLFPTLMIFLCVTTIPIWIELSRHASSFGYTFVFFPIITLVCLLLVAASARYKKTHGLVYFHYACAILAAVCAVLWIFLVAYKILYVGLSILIALMLMGIRTGTLHRCSLFWLETAAFYAIFFSLLIIILFSVNI